MPAALCQENLTQLNLRASEDKPRAPQELLPQGAMADSGAVLETGSQRRKRLRAASDHRRYLRIKGTALYRTNNTWGGMIQRCYNVKSKKYSHYGALGIKVCERWRTFKNFVQDMGLSPAPGMSIDRINGKGNYEPGNCRWATAQQQSQNQSNNRWVTCCGKRVVMAEAARILGLRHSRIFLWLRRHPEFKGDLNRLKPVQHGSRNFIHLANA